MRSGKEANVAHITRMKDAERQVKEVNSKKDQENREMEALKEKEKADAEDSRKRSRLLRQAILDEAAAKARIFREQEDFLLDYDSCSDSEYLQLLN